MGDCSLKLNKIFKKVFIRIVVMGLCPFSLFSVEPQNRLAQDQKHFGTFSEASSAKKWAKRVYLASYPRSGNHWVRYLIEEATGVATSSAYIDPDPQHLKEVFPWGGFCCLHGYEGRSRYPEEGDVAVVKTHYPARKISWFDNLPYVQAIRILRHPVDSFYSLYVWVERISKRSPQRSIPRKELAKYISEWKQFQVYWDAADNVASVRYEDLARDPKFYLKKILDSIGYNVQVEDIERAVAKYPPIEVSSLKHLGHFSKEELETIWDELKDVMKTYGYEIKKVLD